ncbi:MAG: protein translocase subunit SecD, partial [Deltaproteobacteria bacterium]|nr:protein translocase subunit SecD [Deltaproteobacteria bacterium]
MQQGVIARLVIFAVSTLAAAFYLFPTFAGGIPSWWSGVLPAERIHLGLDLQGGSHLILEVKVEKALENTVERIQEEMSKVLKEKAVPPSAMERNRANQIRLKVPAANGDRVRDLLKAEFPNLVLVSSRTESGATEFLLALHEREMRSLREDTVDQSLETIRNRIDQFGVSEPIIQRRGEQDILVQLPGIQDPERAKEIIGKTALLEFKLLDERHSVEEAVKNGPPPGTQVLHGYAAKGEGGVAAEKIPYLLEARTLMTGETITDARVRPASNLEGP